MTVAVPQLEAVSPGVFADVPGANLPADLWLELVKHQLSGPEFAVYRGWLLKLQQGLAQRPFPGEQPATGHRLTDGVREGDDTLAWLVVRTATRREKTAESGLVEAGFAVYTPRLTRWRRTSKTRERITQPLFGGYLFAGMSSRQTVEALIGVDGVYDVVRFSGDRTPVAMIFAEVRKWLRWEQSGRFDKTRKRKDPEPGTPFSITAGAFEGHVGSFVGRGNGERVKLLLSFFGRETELELAEDEVDGLGEGAE